MVRRIDPTRLIDTVSGWHDKGAGDYHVSALILFSLCFDEHVAMFKMRKGNLTAEKDNHHYANPQCGTPFYSLLATPYDPKRIGIQGEFGGIGHNVSEEK